MKVITINLSNNIIELLDLIVSWGYYPSRSELMRRLVELTLPIIQQEILFIQKTIKEKNAAYNIMKFMEQRGFTIKRYHDEKEQNKNEDEKLNGNGKTLQHIKGNPFWETFIDEDGNLCYRNLANPDIIHIPQIQSDIRRLD